MLPKGKYGLYQKVFGRNRDYYIHWPDDTGWVLASPVDDKIWTNGGNGWFMDKENTKMFEGAAMVAPLSTLFW